MRLFVKKVSSSKEFDAFIEKNFKTLKQEEVKKKHNAMKYKVIYETVDTREEVVVNDYNDLINKIKIININNWSLISVKRKM